MLYEGVFRKHYTGIILSSKQQRASLTLFSQLLEHPWMLVMSIWTRKLRKLTRPTKVPKMKRTLSSLVRVSICGLVVLYALEEMRRRVKSESHFHWFCKLMLSYLSLALTPLFAWMPASLKSTTNRKPVIPLVTIRGLSSFQRRRSRFGKTL